MSDQRTLDPHPQVDAWLRLLRKLNATPQERYAAQREADAWLWRRLLSPLPSEASASDTQDTSAPSDPERQ